MIKNIKNGRNFRREPKNSHYDLPMHWYDPAPAACAGSNFILVIASFLPNGIRIEQSMAGLTIKNMKNGRNFRREPKNSHYDLHLHWNDPAPAACAGSNFILVIASFLPNGIKVRAKHDKINNQKHQKWQWKTMISNDKQTATINNDEQWWAMIGNHDEQWQASKYWSAMMSNDE